MKTIIIFSVILALTLCQVEVCDCQPNIKGDTKGTDTTTKACVDPKVTNCEIAQETDASKCTQCKADHFPDANQVSTKCTPIPTADKVVDCKYYNTDKTCSKCVSGKGLGADSKCGAGISNCFVYSGASTALKCEFCDHGYKIKADKTACEDNKINNCKAYNLVIAANPPCLVCEQGYYPASDKCTKSTTVANCKYYELDKDGCGACQLGYFKAVDGKTCTKLTVAKCVHSSTLDKCDFCEGVAPKADKTECSVEVTDKDSNCLGYGVDKKCGNCKDGYGIDANGKCTNKCPTNSYLGSNSQIIAFSLFLVTLVTIVL